MRREFELPFCGTVCFYKRLVDVETDEVVGIALEGPEIFRELYALHSARESRSFILGEYLGIIPSSNAGEEGIEDLLKDAKIDGLVWDSTCDLQVESVQSQFRLVEDGE